MSKNREPSASSNGKNLLKRERQAHILREVNVHNKVLITDLSQKLQVSEDTIRRDLQELADKDKIIKVRGGALSKSYHVYSFRQNDIYAFEEKTAIARKAVQLLKDDMLVLIEGGTTNLEVARLVPPELSATFFTPSLTTALQLLEHPNLEVIFIGGRLSRSTKISIGGEVIQQLTEIRPDLCLMGTNGIDARQGITDSDWDLVQLKKTMIQISSKIAVLTISEKLDSTQPMKICGLNEIDYLVTELDPEHPRVLPYRPLVQVV